MRVLVAPDKFKGSLTAAAAAGAIAEGWYSARPDDEMILRPVADGGEGTAETVCEALGGQWVDCDARDPLGRTVSARYALVGVGDDGGTAAFVECSAASGYLRVRPEERDLLRASTFGTGELLQHALRESGAERVIVGLGGSATNDGGLGLAAALGYRFLDSAGLELPPLPSHLGRLAKIVAPPERPWLEWPVTAACDVQNPLLGPRGATAVYGPQKGLQPDQQPRLEGGLRRLADVAAESLGTDFRDAPGAGAAGGLGFGLLTFCRARLEPGFPLVADLLGLENLVAGSDLVITGEGAADAQSLEGKAPHGVAAMARRLGKKVVLIAGFVAPDAGPVLRQHFDAIYPLAGEGRTVEECMRDAEGTLSRVAANAARRWR